MARICLECQSQVPDTSRQGYCPNCLLKLAEQHTESLEGTHRNDDFRFQLPRTFGGYQLLQVLGEGGMGVVFKAVQTNLNRTVALKMLRSGLLASKDERQRFQAEAQAVGRLKHPGIVAVHEIGEQEGRLFFSMDCIQGHSLAEIVDRTPLAPESAARYTLLISEAVHYAHTQGVLHRDLKPANVIVDEQDQPHVTDFGLAKEISRDPEITRSGVVLGTPSYMSPEQAAGQRKLIKSASDVYSIGAVLYDLLTGRPPFRADSPAETLRQVIEEDPAPVRVLNVKVPRDLETICLKCLAKDPGRRYQSAQEVAEDLGRYLRREPILARRAGRLERAYRLAKKYPAVAALQLAGLVMLGQLVYLAHYSYSDAHDSVLAAPGLAKGLADAFHQIGDVVWEVASDSNLVESVRAQKWGPLDWTLQTNDWTLQTNREKNEVLKCLDKILKQRPEWSELKSNQNWVLLDRNGLIRANWTSDSDARLVTNALAHRHYFQVLTNLSKRYHVSKAYKSQFDERYKVAVIAPVLFQEQFIGALGRMTAYKDLANETARTKEVVIAGMDSDPISDSANTRYAVIWHPNLDEKNIKPIGNESLIQTIDRVMKEPRGETIARYRDPAGSGLWVAGLARVRDTPLVQVYQVRDRVTEAMVIGGFLFAFWALGLAIWLLRRRHYTRTKARAL